MPELSGETALFILVGSMWELSPTRKQGHQPLNFPFPHA